jgi:putative ATPase
LPGELEGRRYYQPVPRGLEIRIAEKLAHLRELDRAGEPESSCDTRSDHVK